MSRYKSVLIVGNGIILKEDIKNLYERDDYIIIGDGKKTLKELSGEIEALRGEIDENTIININAHGDSYNKIHYIDKLNTKDFLVNLARINNNRPININLFSCFGGTARRDVKFLPINSVLTCISEKNISVKALGCFSLMLEFNKPDSSSVLNLINNIHKSSSYLVTISRRTGIDSIEKISLKDALKDKCEEITDIEFVRRILTNFRNELIESHNKNAVKSKKIDINKLKIISDEDCINWAKDYFVYLIDKKDNKLLELLKKNPTKFRDPIDFLNCRNYIGMCALTKAVLNGNIEIVELLIKAGCDVNRSSFYMNPLYHAVEKNDAHMVQILINGGAKPNSFALKLAEHKKYTNIIKILKGEKIKLPEREDRDNSVTSHTPPIKTASDTGSVSNVTKFVIAGIFIAAAIGICIYSGMIPMFNFGGGLGAASSLSHYADMFKMGAFNIVNYGKSLLSNCPSISKLAPSYIDVSSKVNNLAVTTSAYSAVIGSFTKKLIDNAKSNLGFNR